MHGAHHPRQHWESSHAAGEHGQHIAKPAPTWEAPPGTDSTRDEGLSVRKLPTCAATAGGAGLRALHSLQLSERAAAPPHTMQPSADACGARAHILASRPGVVVVPVVRAGLGVGVELGGSGGGGRRGRGRCGHTVLSARRGQGHGGPAHGLLELRGWCCCHWRVCRVIPKHDLRCRGCAGAW